MTKLSVYRNQIRNCNEIVALIAKYKYLFTNYPSPEGKQQWQKGDFVFDPFRSSEYEEQDQYHVLPGNAMPRELLDLIVSSVDIPIGFNQSLYLQINCYEQGDYILPHRDDFLQGVYVLTRSFRDGLTVQNKNGVLIRVPDEPGTLIITDTESWHWVDPVLDRTRYTIVTIPPLITLIS